MAGRGDRAARAARVRGAGVGGDLRRRVVRRAGGERRQPAWQVYPGFDDNYWDIAPSCPELGVWSERRANAFAPFFNGAGYHIKAPAGATLDKIAIWRKGYRFNNTGKTPQGPWAVGGYRGDGTVIGGPLLGETCNIQPGQIHCEMPYWGTRVDRDLETNEVLYSVSCFEEPNCPTARPEDGFPFAGLTISASIVTVRDEGRPTIVARGPLTATGWRTNDAPLHLGASDPVGVRRVRILVDGAQVRAIAPGCDYTRVAPCGQVPERAVRLGAAVPDGSHVVGVEATDTAGNVARVDRRVTVDRNPPPLEFLPARGRKRIAVAARDAGSGTTAGTIEVRRRGHVPRAADAAARDAARRAARARLAARADVPGERCRRGRAPRGRCRRARAVARGLRSADAALGTHRAERTRARARPAAGRSPGGRWRGAEIIVESRLRRGGRRAGARRAGRDGRARPVPGPRSAGRQPRPDRALAGDRRPAGRAPQAEPARAVVVDAEDPPAHCRAGRADAASAAGCGCAASSCRGPASASSCRRSTAAAGASSRRRARSARAPGGARATASGRRPAATASACGSRTRARSRSTAATRARSPCGWADRDECRLVLPMAARGDTRAVAAPQASLATTAAKLGAPRGPRRTRRPVRGRRPGAAGSARTARDRRGGGGRVAGRVEPPARGRDDLERTRRGGRDDRAARGERLDEREPERLALGAVQQAVGVGERRRAGRRPRRGTARGRRGRAAPRARAARRRSPAGRRAAARRPGRAAAPARAPRSRARGRVASTGTSAPRHSARGGGPGGAGQRPRGEVDAGVDHVRAPAAASAASATARRSATSRRAAPSRGAQQRAAAAASRAGRAGARAAARPRAAPTRPRAAAAGPRRRRHAGRRGRHSAATSRAERGEVERRPAVPPAPLERPLGAACAPRCPAPRAAAASGPGGHASSDRRSSSARAQSSSTRSAPPSTPAAATSSTGRRCPAAGVIDRRGALARALGAGAPGAARRRPARACAAARDANVSAWATSSSASARGPRVAPTPRGGGGRGRRTARRRAASRGRPCAARATDGCRTVGMPAARARRQRSMSSANRCAAGSNGPSRRSTAVSRRQARRDRPADRARPRRAVRLEPLAQPRRAAAARGAARRRARRPSPAAGAPSAARCRRALSSRGTCSARGCCARERAPARRASRRAARSPG